MRKDESEAGGHRVHAASLEALVAAIFEAAGCEGEEARTIAAHLVLSNLVGHDSHGIIRLREYIPWIAEGMVRPNQHATVIFESPVAVTVDGGLGFGQWIGEEAIGLAIAKASTTGLAALAIRNTGHLGRIGHWAERCAHAGLVSLHFVNTSGFGVLVAPVGSREARLSANPFSAGVPLPGGEPIILDISTASIAEGKIKVARNAGKELPAGSVLDGAGQPTRDPRAFYGPPRGAILPFGGHKGYGLSVIIEALAGALAGGGCTDPGREGASQLINNMCSFVMRPDLFGNADLFAAELMGFHGWLKSARPADPDDEVLLPGELERRSKADRSANGIPLDEATFAELTTFARQFEIELPEQLLEGGN